MVVNAIRLVSFECPQNNDFCNGLGNGLMDEKEFRTWIARIQALRDETSPSSPSTSKAMTQSEIDDDASQDLIAAFR